MVRPSCIGVGTATQSCAIGPIECVPGVRAINRPTWQRVLPDARVPRIPRDVFCYFDNTDKLHAPKNARRLMQMLEVQWAPCRTVTAPIRAAAQRR